jgi:hypothetical protein
MCLNRVTQWHPATNRQNESAIRLEFEATEELLHAIASVIAAERHCCRFLRFQLG